MHEAAENLLEEKGILHEGSFGFERDARCLQVRGSPGARLLGRRSKSARLVDQAAELLVGDGLDVELKDLPGQRGNDARRLGPAARTTDRQDLRAPRVLQAAEGAEPPEDLVLAVDDHVAVVDVLDFELVRVLAEVAGADDLVPEVDGA